MATARSGHAVAVIPMLTPSRGHGTRSVVLDGDPGIGKSAVVVVMRMNNQTLNQAGHLSHAELGGLLADDTDTAAVQTLLTHLDGCETCQSRLAELAADANDWDACRTLLSGDDVPRWQPDLSQADDWLTVSQLLGRVARDQIARLLETPTHPEMLGRLGRYDIERIIGSGGMGVVLKAHDSELNRPIAIKLLAPELAHNGAARERFAREGRAAAAVVHEHVVGIYNVESGGAVPYLVMQYVPGRSLETRVTEDGPLDVAELLRIGAQAAAGLAAAHRQGLVHRDVKPANILLENSVERAVLTDFGLARAIDDASLTRTGILAGTPHYMSPEQARGELVDHRSDLFSLGSVLYYMATGRPPFRGSTAMGVLHRICREPHKPVWQVNHDVPDEVSDVIDRLLAKKPSQRFASAEDVQAALGALLSQVQSGGLKRRRLRSWSRNLNRTWPLWAAAAAMCVLIAAVALWNQLKSPESHGNTSSRAQTSNDTVQFDLSLWHELQGTENEFVDTLARTRRDLSGAEVDFRYLQIGDGKWHRELQSVSQDIHRMEFGNSKPVQ